MKKILLLTAVAALAFTACKKDPTPTPGPDPTPVSDVITGTGTFADPYVLYKPEHLDSISVLAKSQTWGKSRADYIKADSTCFKLGNNIDLGGKDWTPIDLGMEKQQGKKIDFNGAGFTIKNFKITASQTEGVGFFGNLVGNVHDLKIEGADISTTESKKIGVIVGVASTGDYIWTKVYNCYAKGKITCDGKTAEANKYDMNLGGIVGQQCFGEIHECESDVIFEVNGATYPYYIGGIVGTLAKKQLEVRNCISRGEYKYGADATAYMIGGIVGAAKNKDHNIIENCISLAKITCYAMAGGIIAELNGDSNGGDDGSDVQDKTSEVKKCIAWNEGITANANVEDKLQFASSGAIVGLGGACAYTDCYRKAAFAFSCKNLSGDVFPISAFNDNTTAGAATKVGPYNGKEAAAGKTASAVATELGWDTTIWDLTGDVPALKCLK